MMDLFELTTEQKKAFNKLKKAHSDCLKLDIKFYNNYGRFGAMDGKKINRYDDIKENGIKNNCQNIDNEFNLDCCEWADDTHYFHPTEKLIKELYSNNMIF